MADDFYVNMNLSTEMELPQGRDTVLHYFERIQKKYPTMRKFYCRDKRDFVLEEDKDRSQYRWTTVENRRLCSGQVNPATIEEAMEQHRLVLELAPFMLSRQSAGLRSARSAVRLRFHLSRQSQSARRRSVGREPVAGTAAWSCPAAA